jgi:hypothetical protein
MNRYSALSARFNRQSILYTRTDRCTTLSARFARDLQCLPDPPETYTVCQICQIHQRPTLSARSTRDLHCLPDLPDPPETYTVCQICQIHQRPTLSARSARFGRDLHCLPDLPDPPDIYTQ